MNEGLKNTPSPPIFSICIYAGRRGPIFDACLNSLREQIDPPSFELLVVVDRQPIIAQQVLDVFPEADIQMTTGANPGAARNVLIEKARGDLLVFLDDDVVAERDLLRCALEIASAHPNVGVFGGPNLTPPGSSQFQFVQGAVLGSVVGAGPVRKRYGVHAAGSANETALTLCNLIVRREVAVPFARDLVCAEENEAMRRLRRSGVVMRSEPDLVVYHERRDSGGSFAAQMYKYGRGRGQLMRRDPRSLRMTHVVPAAWCLYLLLLPLLALWNLLWFIPAIVYLLAVSVASLWIAHCTGRLRPLRQMNRRFALSVGLMLVVHVSYGLGIYRGLLRRQNSAVPDPTWVPAGRAAEPPLA